MTKRKFTKNTTLKMTAAFLFPFALFGGGMALSQNKAVAENSEIAYSYQENVSLTNSNFQSGNKPSHKDSGSGLSGWTAINSESLATGMLIDVGSGENTEEGSTETTTFAKNKDEYMLSSNPGSNGPKADTRILMINSKAKLSQKNVETFKGYRSTSVTLAKNSYYRFSVSALAMLNGDDYAMASVYLNGVKDKDGNEVDLGYENITSSTWKEYFFFVATGDEAQTVTLDLYLGTKSGIRSEGAVFFDNANIVRYSQNEFYSICKDYGYKGADVYGAYDENTKFVVNKLQTLPRLVEGTDVLNFDFEDEVLNNTTTLGDYWHLSSSDKSNADARIVNIRDMQPTYFEELTGQSYVGDDFTKDNTQALVLWTNNNEYSSGYVGVKSSDISVKAHNVYKISLNVKVEGIESGSFYVKVSETDAIYDIYPTLLSDDKDAKNYYELASEKTSGITSNTSNSWTNDYQTVEFYVKGHSVYNSFINLEFWLGDVSTEAKGCAVVDNVQIEYANYSDYQNASNKLELSSFASESSSTDNFANRYFNNTEMNEDNKYPIVASGWTTEKSEEKYNESGVVLIGSQQEYEDLYNGKYAWAGIRPSSTSQSAMANNIYMMFNSKNSYQSLTSSQVALSTANEYYVLSFDYYNQAHSSLELPQIKVEVVDENGITLFTEEGLSSLDAWNTMKVYFHLPKNVSHNVKVKVSLGDEYNKVGGLVYLDNFNIDISDETAFSAGTYKSELKDYYFNLSENGSVGKEVSSSPAYSLSVDEVYASGYTTENCDTVAGIVSGQENEFGVESDENLLVISNKVASKATLKSKYKLSFEADKYYLLSFDLKTTLAKSNADDHDCKYGLSIKLDGYDAVEGLLSAEELKEFKIYYKSADASTPSISFSLISDCDQTLGTALLTKLNLEETTAEIYNSLDKTAGYNSSVFTAQVENAEEEPEKPEEENKENENTEGGLNTALVLASSLIMGIALIVAIVGLVLRKIKIKKIDKVRKESYDRKLSANHDAILTEAQKRRDEEVKVLQNTRNSLIEEKAVMEERHKEFVRNSRQANGKLSRDVEKAFKKYNGDVARINEKINIVKEKIDYVMTAEYLLTIQRKILMEEEDKIAKEKKARKQALKAKIDEE